MWGVWSLRQTINHSSAQCLATGICALISQTEPTLKSRQWARAPVLRNTILTPPTPSLRFINPLRVPQVTGITHQGSLLSTSPLCSAQHICNRHRCYSCSCLPFPHCSGQFPPVLLNHQDKQLQAASFPPGQSSHMSPPHIWAHPGLHPDVTPVDGGFCSHHQHGPSCWAGGVSGCCYKGLLADNFKETRSENVFTIFTSTCSILKSFFHYCFSNRQILCFFFFFLNPLEGIPYCLHNKVSQRQDSFSQILSL